MIKNLNSNANNLYQYYLHLIMSQKMINQMKKLEKNVKITCLLMFLLKIFKIIKQDCFLNNFIYCMNNDISCIIFVFIIVLYNLYNIRKNITKTYHKIETQIETSVTNYNDEIDAVKNIK